MRPQPRWPRRTLPLRVWLILAVAAITGAGFLAQLGLTTLATVWEQQRADAQLASIRSIIGTDASQWSNPAWQHRSTALLSALGVDLALFPAQAQSSTQLGPAIYMTAGARRYLTAGSHDTPGVTRLQLPAEAPTFLSAQVAFQRVVIMNPEQSANRSPVGIVFLWYSQPGPGEALGILWPAVELGTFALTLALVVWLIGQPVLRPLAAMGRAVEGIAGGDLSVELPSTPVREIAEVGAALKGMSAALKGALDRQSALEEERRLFVGAIAHDLRTPLFMLRGHLKGLERSVAGTPEKMAHYVAVCQAKADTLERLISDLFAYTRLEYLDQASDRTPLELGELLRQAVESEQPQAATRGIILALKGTDEPCLLRGDSRLLTRAVENLLDNALCYTPEGGTIEVCWSQTKHSTAFTVEDTGPGISAEDLPHLFTPLYRGESSRNRQTGSAGLGLAISRRIMQAHGGDLTAANSPKGGAMFTAMLPVKRYDIAMPDSVADVATA